MATPNYNFGDILGQAQQDPFYKTASSMNDMFKQSGNNDTYNVWGDFMSAHLPGVGTVHNNNNGSYSVWQDGIQNGDTHFGFTQNPNGTWQSHENTYDDGNTGFMGSLGKLTELAVPVAIGAIAGGAGGLWGGGAGSAGGTAASTAEYLSAADMAGGLLPEFGTTAAYEAGLAGAGAAGAAGLGGLDVAGLGLNQYLPEGATGALGKTAMGGLGSLFTGGSSGSGQGGGNSGINWSKLSSLLYDTYSKNQIANQFKDTMDQITGMYKPGSPEALQMQREIEARDAKMGRRSQYGPRSVELNAKLAQERMRALNSPAFMNLQAAYLNNNLGSGGLAGLLGGASSGYLTNGIGDDLIGGFINRALSGLGDKAGSFLDGLFS